MSERDESSAGWVPDHPGLVLRGIGKTYYTVNVLNGVNMDVRPGEMVALIGENGAGKSTLSSVIAGLIAPDEGGKMWWQGKPYSPSAPADALHAGIGLIHQEMRLLPHLSIAENVFVGRLPMKGGRIDTASMIERSQRQLQRLGLNVPATRKVSSLRVAAQQQVEIAKALTLNARLLILDEPTAALGDEETDRLFEQILKLKAEGVSFIYVSHRLAEIARIADRIVVLRDGQQVAQHDTAQLPTSVLVRDMVGRNVDRLFPQIPEPPAEARTALSVRNLTAPDGSFKDISFDIKEGEVFGLAGIIGAGRTELVRAIAGVDPVESGEIVIRDKKIEMRSPADAIREDLVLVPDDRKALGVVLTHSIGENMTYNNFDQVAPDGWVRPSKARQFAAGMIRRLGVKGAPEQLAGSLSGGNQQKVVIAKWIARNPKVIILDEPTRGIDVGARAAIYEVIAELASSGMAVIVVSSDLEEVLGLSHRVMVMSRGEARGTLPRAEVDSSKVMELAVI
ncbi:MAG: sugar ABC transporter ATP-binding protein [Propionivibrio sp.]|jgi:ribose transport system ATP-binding protein|nr:sugar ABC transporter ATP-binding protein [Propionivibrio sp.]MBP6710017.1 sugar ABC transporter ATP-binding protein [Propionivibrio sp.]MBP7523447.1 sugar ABC transporter ATP-binding protein [Propionivibrio sp.]MBP8162056.1 sugar ABC transporter ATP-binding protein [Propionivibrio sp.]